MNPSKGSNLPREKQNFCPNWFDTQVQGYRQLARNHIRAFVNWRSPSFLPLNTQMEYYQHTNVALVSWWLNQRWVREKHQEWQITKMGLFVRKPAFAYTDRVKCARNLQVVHPSTWTVCVFSMVFSAWQSEVRAAACEFVAFSFG